MPSVPSAEASVTPLLLLLHLLLMMMLLLHHCGDARPLVHRAVCPHKHSTASATSPRASTVLPKHPLKTLDDEATFNTATSKQMKNEVADEAAVTIGRRRRAASKMKFHGISHTNDRLVALPREVKNMIREYLEWRRHNGYGKMTRRWGK